MRRNFNILLIIINNFDVVYITVLVLHQKTCDYVTRLEYQW